MKATEVSQRFVQSYYSLVGLRIVKTRSEFCKEIGIFPSTFSIISNGERLVTIEQLCKLNERYNISFAWLFGESDKMFVNGN